jgi:hypothetical protein
MLPVLGCIQSHDLDSTSAHSLIPSPLSMAFDVFAQFSGSCGDFTACESIHNSPVTFDPNFPFGFLDALSESLKKDMQQIAERDEGI